MTITTDIEKLKSGFDGFLARVQAGDELVIQVHDQPVAKLVPVPKTKNLPFGCGAGTVKILGPIDEPLFSDEEWEKIMGGNLL